MTYRGAVIAAGEGLPRPHSCRLHATCRQAKLLSPLTLAALPNALLAAPVTCAPLPTAVALATAMGAYLPRRAVGTDDRLVGHSS